MRAALEYNAGSYRGPDASRFTIARTPKVKSLSMLTLIMRPRRGFQLFGDGLSRSPRYLVQIRTTPQLPFVD